MANHDDQQQTGLFAALIALAAGLALLAILVNWQDEIDSAVFIALLFFPLIAYALFSGAVSEISGPGGWGAKFRSVAQQPVDIDAEIEPMSVVEKADPQKLERQVDQLSSQGSVAMQMMVGDGPPYYSAMAVNAYLDALRRIDPQLIIVIADTDKRFLASTDAMSLDRLTRLDSLMDDFLGHLRDENLTGIRTLLPLTSRSVQRGASNAVALKIMLEDGVDNLVVTDEFAKPVGVVKRDKIVARLMAELAEQ